MSAAAATTRRSAKAARAAEPLTASTAAFPETRKQESAWLEALATALDHAANTEEAGSWSGESDRLLRVAHELADHMHIHPDEAGACRTIDNRAHTIAALIKAALQVPGDTPSPERLEFIEQTRAPLVALTGCATVLDGWDTYPRKYFAASQAAPEPQREWLHDILSKVEEAAAVLRTIAEDSATEPIWGLVRLADWLANEVQVRAGEKQASETAFDACAADIASVLSILHLVAEHDDHVLIHAAGSILEVASSFCEAAQESGHA